MFHIMRNNNEYGTLDLVERFMQALRTAVPLGTLNRIDYEPANDWDAVIRWEVGTASIRLGVEVRLGPIRSNVPDLNSEDSTIVPVLVAPFLSRAARQELEGRNWSYWDTTGNLLVRSEVPVVAIRLEGSTKDPDPEPSPLAKLKTLKGRAASEVLVGLLANGGNAGSLRDFAREHDLPVATVSRVVALLREENLIAPTGGGPIVLTDRLQVARRWADDYSFVKSFRARRYRSLNGPRFGLSRIVSSGVEYAITGVSAAQNWLEGTDTPTAFPATDTWVYVSDLSTVERGADLAPDPRGGQFVLAECDFLGRERPRTSGEYKYVTPWRIVGDLLSTGGRAASVGERLANNLIKRPT